VIQVIWEFRVVPGKESEFERHYGPNGTWVHLFRKTTEFLGTELLRDSEVPGRYLTVDCWKDLKPYESFRKEFAAEYKGIDDQMEALTDSETRVGVFEVV
jgi:heme-degrading monooxygenase HmoA